VLTPPNFWVSYSPVARPDSRVVAALRDCIGLQDIIYVGVHLNLINVINSRVGVFSGGGVGLIGGISGSYGDGAFFGITTIATLSSAAAAQAAALAASAASSLASAPSVVSASGSNGMVQA
jgi:hypothetical protein